MAKPWFSLHISPEAKAIMRSRLNPADFHNVMGSIQMALDRRQEMIQRYIAEHGTPMGDRILSLLTVQRRETDDERGEAPEAGGAPEGVRGDQGPSDEAGREGPGPGSGSEGPD